MAGRWVYGDQQPESCRRVVQEEQRATVEALHLKEGGRGMKGDLCIGRVFFVSWTTPRPHHSIIIMIFLLFSGDVDGNGTEGKMWSKTSHSQSVILVYTSHLKAAAAAAVEKTCHLVAFCCEYSV